MKRIIVVALLAFVFVASSAMGYECTKGPSKGAEQFFAQVVEHLVKGESQAVLKVSVKAIQSKAQDFKKMVDYVSSYGPPKTMNLIAYKCYPQDPGYERFYAVLCYSQNKALGLDITLTHTQKGLVLRHLRVDARQGLEKYCQ